MVEYPALDLTYLQDSDTAELLELVHATLDDFAPLAIAEHEAGDGWRVFFRERSLRDRALETLSRVFGSRLTSMAAVDVKDDGWARRSQEQLTAVAVGRVIVAPPWAAPGPAASHAVVVVIRPSMGFGTGHHATTRLCLTLLQKLPLRERRLIDVGTGSGVLALAAWKLGAARAWAIDCDPDAIRNARENVELNGGREGIEIVEADLAQVDLTPADVVVANLTLSALQRHAERLRALVSGGGWLVVSGFGREELVDVERAFGRAAVESLVEDSWCAARFSPARTEP